MPPSFKARSTAFKSLWFGLILLSGLVLCGLMLLPFLSMFVWAGTLALLFSPLQRAFESRFASKSLCALLTTAIICVIIVLPLVLVTQHIGLLIMQVSQVVDQTVHSGEWRILLQGYPLLSTYFSYIERYLDVPTSLQSLSTWIMNHSATFLRGSLLKILHFGLIFYILFFILRDRSLGLKSLRHVIPFTASEYALIGLKLKDTVHALVYGTFLIAALQGLLGGLMFWWVGLQGPIAWGLVMALFAVIPMLGAFVVWIPAVLYLFVQGAWLKALVLSIWGVAVVGTIDNLLRPYLVGNKLHLHTLIIFFSMLGGLQVFDAVGLILGPLITVSSVTMVEIWQHRMSVVTYRAVTSNEKPSNLP